MVSEAIQAPLETVVDQAIPEQETETPATPEVVESAAPATEEAAAPRIEIEEPKAEQYVTKAELESMKAEVARQAAAEAIEKERRQRQTEGARKAAQAAREKESLAELNDTLRASLVSKGYASPDDDSLAVAVQRSVGKAKGHITEETLAYVDQAWDWVVGASDERPDHPATDVVHKRLQAFTDQIRPLIEAKAREGYVAETEVADRVKKAVEADRAARNAKAREGQEDIQRVEGTVGTTDIRTWWRGLSAREKADPTNQARYDAYTASLG